MGLLESVYCPFCRRQTKKSQRQFFLVGTTLLLFPTCDESYQNFQFLRQKCEGSLIAHFACHVSITDATSPSSFTQDQNTHCRCRFPLTMIQLVVLLLKYLLHNPSKTIQFIVSYIAVVLHRPIVFCHIHVKYTIQYCLYTAPTSRGLPPIAIDCVRTISQFVPFWYTVRTFHSNTGTPAKPKN